MFKNGDLVRIKDTQNIRSWSKGIECIGKTFVINYPISKNDQFERWLKEDRMSHRSCVCDDKNTYSINYLPSDLELVNPIQEINYEIY